jgi:8-oxo-dGTP pyrophosphatase MutT (NUDIX family)
MRKTLRSTGVDEVYKDAWLTIKRHTTSDGEAEGSYTTIERQDASIVVATPDDLKHVVLVEVGRFPIERMSLEFPAGGVDGDEKPIEAAVRELSEETGLAVRECRQIGSIFPLPGLTSQRVFVYRCDIFDFPEKGEGREKHDADIASVRLVAWSEVMEMVRLGEISDGLTLSAIALVLSQD